MENALCHFHHLFFFCVAVADDRHLDLIRCIGDRMQPLLRECEQNNAACLRNLNAGCDVFREEKLLDCHLVRVKCVHQRTDIIINLT